MRIEVWDRGFKASKGLTNYAGLRLMSVLDHLVRQVDEVAVCLADVDAPCRGIEKRCRMLARLIPSGAVRVEDAHSGLYAAIDRAAERLADAVALDQHRRDLVAATPLGQAGADAVEIERPRRLPAVFAR